MVRNLAGRDADEALDLARQCVADGRRGAGRVSAATAWCTSASRRSPAPTTPLGIIPAGTGNDVARYFDLPAQGPGGRGRPAWSRGAHAARSTWPAAASKYFVTVLAAGFDAIVNERANRMTWPKGQMRYNLATLAELRTFGPIPYTLELDGEQRRLDAMLVAVGNGPSFGGGLRITEGALLDDGMLDVVIIKPMSKLEPGADLPKLFRGTHVTHPQYEHHRVRTGDRRRAGHRGVRRRRAVRCAAADRRVRPGGADASPGALTGAMSTADDPRRALRRVPPQPRAPVLATSRASTTSRSTTSRSRPAEEIEDGRGVLVAAPDRLRQDAWSGSSRCTWRSRPAASASTRRRSRRCRTRSSTTWSTRYGADQVGLLTGDNTINGEAPVVVMTTEVLRNMLYAGSRTLLGLGFVVMDEVHYLADRARGAVWEEVIIHLPESVALVSPVGDRLQRRGVRRVAGDRPRRDHHHRRGAPAGAALPARDGRAADARPVRVLRRRRGCRLRQGGRTGQRRAAAVARDDWASSRLMRDRRRPARASRGRRSRPAAGRQRPARLDPEPGRRGRAARPRRAAARDRVHLQPGRLRRGRPAVPERRTCG